MLAHAPTPRPAQVVRSQVIARMPNTPRSGTRVASRRVGVRTFIGDDLGVGLAGIDGGTFPAQTTDGGRVWRIDGPVLYTDTADAPLAVSTLTAQSRRVRYAFGAAGNVIDVTGDGGRVWRRALFANGVPVAVVPALSGGGIVAYVQVGTNLARVTTLQYVSRDGGATWRLSTALGGGG